MRINNSKKRIRVKILVVRFSSIGDIVLTSSVLRAIKDQLPGTTIHYFTKSPFVSLVEENPNVDKVFGITNSIQERIKELKEEKYDVVIDLHNNIRTLSLKRKLNTKSYSFNKLNLRKWILVKLKVNKLPNIHVVDRYFEAVQHLGVYKDNLPGEFYINEKNQVDVKREFNLAQKKYLSVAIGAQFSTKKMPLSLLERVLEKVTIPVVIVGGEMDNELANQLIVNLPNKEIINACGEFNIQASASIVKQSSRLLTNDTGMMHIGACFGIPIVSVWGNTVPDFGMFPYHPEQKDLVSIHEVKGLGCRPCSKIGYQTCPKKHFDCMNKQSVSEIAEALVD